MPRFSLYQPDGADYAHHITASIPRFENLTTSLLSVLLLNTLRDPTQLRRRQCATRQHPFFVAHQKEGIDQPKEVQHHIGGGQQQKNMRNPLNSRIWVRSIPSF